MSLRGRSSGFNVTGNDKSLKVVERVGWTRCRIAPIEKRVRGEDMPHRLKVLEQKSPTVKEIIEQLAAAEAKEIERLKREASKKNK